MADNSFGETDAEVGVIMGSRNDWETMKRAAEVLDELGIPNERLVVSAHRTPARMVDYAVGAAGRGLKVIIAGAGGTAQSARYGRVRNESARDRRAHSKPCSARARLPAVDRPDARWNPGGHDVDWHCGCEKRWNPCSTDSGTYRRRAANPPGRIR